MDKNKAKDIKYAITKAGLGSIPIIGAAASELLSLIIAPPLEQRREKWMTEIGEKLKELEQNNKIDLDLIRENPVFIDTVLQTTHLALQTSEKEKIELYKNCLINCALGDNPEQAEIQIFLNFIASFTVWHIKILKLFDNPTDWYKINNLAAPSFMTAGLSSILELAYPELKGRSDFYNLIWNDLLIAGLHSTGSLQSMMSSNGLMANRTTAFGKRFLNFIQENVAT